MAGEATAGTEPTGHGGPDLTGSKADLESGGGEFLAHSVVVEVAGADQLAERERGPVEGVVPVPERGGADTSNLGGERRAGPRSRRGGALPRR
jgi:hypothetical protein